MLIKDWMARKVLTIEENTSVLRAGIMMKENQVRRLPVTSHGKLVGVVTDRDLKEASPSKTSALDIHELHYLLAEMRVKDVMTKNPISFGMDDTLEKAALVMLQNKISGLPIVDESGNLIGLVSETDVLRGFIHATGIADGNIHYILSLRDEPGIKAGIIDICRKHGARLISILTSYIDADDGTIRVSLRISCPCTEDQLKAIHDKIAQVGTIVHCAKDDLKDLPRKKK